MIKTTIITLAATCIFAASSFGEMRTWTNTQGKTMDAEFVSLDKDKVSLTTKAGKKIKIPVKSLSQEDQDFIKELTAEKAPKLGHNYDNEWPKTTKVVEGFEAEMIQEGPDEYIYETPHFKFICDTKIGKSVIKQLALLFEATHEANRCIPIGNIRAHRKDLKFPAYLYEKQSDYLAKGGMEGSAGIFMGNSNPNDAGKTLVPFDSLGVKKAGKSYIVDRSKSSRTLIHELTHQLMTYNSKLAGWFCEGSAEYIANTPYINGKFNFAGNKKTIISFATGFDKKYGAGRNLGDNLKAPELESFMTMPYSTFTGDNANFNYGFSLLLVYYWYHLDGDGDAKRIKEYIKALDAGKTPLQANELLLDGRTYSELEKEIQQKWRKNGIKITFGDN